MKISIYIATQELHDFPQNADYKPIFVGAAENERFLSDSTGESISGRNRFYSELTGHYWIWKNDTESDVVGLCHYRRFLWLNKVSWRLRRKSFSSIADCEKLLLTDNIEKWMRRYDIIMPRPDAFSHETLKEHFSHYIGAFAYDLMYEAVWRISPEYMDTFSKVFNRRWGSFANLMIAKKPLFDRYSKWLFPILQDIEEHMDKRDEKTLRLLGHCSERLLNVFVAHNHLRVKSVPQIVLVRPGEPLSESPCLDMRYLKRRYMPWMVEIRERIRKRLGRR